MYNILYYSANTFILEKLCNDICFITKNLFTMKIYTYKQTGKDYANFPDINYHVILKIN